MFGSRHVSTWATTHTIPVQETVESAGFDVPVCSQRRVYDLQRTWDSQHNNVRSANWQSVLPESMYCVACTHAYFGAWRFQGPLLSEGRLEII